MKKLDPYFQGPCRIDQVLSPSSFIICRLSDGVNLGVTNIDRLKPFYEPNEIRNPSLSPVQQSLHSIHPPLMSIDPNHIHNVSRVDLLRDNQPAASSLHSPRSSTANRLARIRTQPNRLNL